MAQYAFGTASGAATFTFTFYLIGTYSGWPSAILTSISCTVPKTETRSAYTSGGNTAYASTTNSSIQSSSGTNVGGPATFSNSPTVTTMGSGWQLQPDGSYKMKVYAFANTLSASATNNSPGLPPHVAGAGAVVRFNITNVVASH